MKKILIYDLKEYVRENIFMLFLITVLIGTFIPSFTTLKTRNLSFIINIYEIGLMFFLLDTLNKAVNLRIIIGFPSDTLYFLQYLSFKFQLMGVVVGAIVLSVINILADVNIIQIIGFYIISGFVSLGYYFIYCLFYRKILQISFLDLFPLIVVLAFTLFLFNILFYLIKDWILILVLAMIILFNLFFLKKAAKILSHKMIDILENANESD